MSNDLEFLEINLELAANKMIYGSHPPMNDFSAKLLKEPWLNKLKYSGYSSSCVTFEIENKKIKYVSVFSSYHAILNKYRNRVSLNIYMRDNSDLKYSRENFEIEQAIEILKSLATSKESLENENMVEVDREMDENLIILKDGWYNHTRFIELLEKLSNIEDIERKYIFKIENLEHFPLDFIFYIEEKFKKNISRDKRIYIYSKNSEINDYFKYYEEKGEKINLDIYDE